MRAYVEIPIAPKFLSTQQSSQSGKKMRARPTVVLHGNKDSTEIDEDDLGGFGPEEDSPHRPGKTGLSMTEAGTSSAKRTGDRDDRGSTSITPCYLTTNNFAHTAPLEKLITLLEDIFEAEDSLPVDVDQECLQADFFSPLTAEPSRPQLHPNLVRKLSKLISQVARPMKRLRSSTATVHTPYNSGLCGIADVETTILSRVLKILERSVRAGEDLDPFKTDKPLDMRASVSPSKRSKVSAKKPISDQQLQSQTLVGGEPQADASADPAELPSVTSADLDILTRTLEIARDSILAADCCIALLSADRLPKQVYSEELITACLGAVKNQLDRIVYPFVESSDNSALLQHVSRHEKAHRAQIAEVFQVLTSVLPRINNLVCADTVTMSDSIIIQGVYIAIGPFFVTEAGASDSKGKKESFVMNTLGQTAMRGLRMEALSLIRSVSFISVVDAAFIIWEILQIFANHEEQRPWIIEEILSSLIKLSDTKQKAGQFRYER
jgi:cohesin loading factor subunit SCC2